MSVKDFNARAWSWTLFNYNDEDISHIKSIKQIYLVFGYEICPKTLKPHLQGFIYFKDAKTFSATKKAFKNKEVHLEVSHGTPDENRKYCLKIRPVDLVANEKFEEYGECPQQGRRTDVETVREELKSGNGMRGVVRVATNLQQLKIAEAILKYEEPKRTWCPVVEWFYGGTGTGKSRAAHELFEGKDFYRKTANSGKWFEGYDAHEFVIIDDLDTSAFNYKCLLDLLDRYETRVETKGGSRQFLAKHIIITSSTHPKILFSYESAQGAELLRRITNIKEFASISI